MTISAGWELGLGLRQSPPPSPSIMGPPTLPSNGVSIQRREEMLPWNRWQPYVLFVGNFPIWEGVTSREDHSGMVRSRLFCLLASVGVTGTPHSMAKQSPAFARELGKWWMSSSLWVGVLAHSQRWMPATDVWRASDHPWLDCCARNDLVPFDLPRQSYFLLQQIYHSNDIFKKRWDIWQNGKTFNSRSRIEGNCFPGQTQSEPNKTFGIQSLVERPQFFLSLPKSFFFFWTSLSGSC